MKSFALILFTFAFVDLNSAYQEYYQYQNEFGEDVVDKLLDSGYISQAAVIGPHGRILAASRDFWITEEEGDYIQHLFRHSPDSPLFFRSELTVAGVRYPKTEYTEFGSIYGTGYYYDGGVVCVQTDQSVIIGVYPFEVDGEIAREKVEKLGNYLRERGF